MFAHGIAAFQSQNAQQQPVAEKLHNATQHTICVGGELLVAPERLLLTVANIQLCSRSKNQLVAVVIHTVTQQCKHTNNSFRLLFSTETFVQRGKRLNEIVFNSSVFK